MGYAGCVRYGARSVLLVGWARDIGLRRSGLEEGVVAGELGDVVAVLGEAFVLLAEGRVAGWHTIVVGNEEAEPGVAKVLELGDRGRGAGNDEPQVCLASRPEREARAKRRPMIVSKRPVVATCARGSKKA